MFRRLAIFAVFSLLACPALRAAEEFHCEVLELKGSVTATNPQGAARQVKQGDLLRAGDVVKTGEDSFVDLAYDKDWKNLSRLESNSRVKIASIAPGKLELKEGGVFAKLKKLPRDSSFEVRTPTAVATVRGSEYRITFLLGQTDVFNADRSSVVVYGIAADGSVDKSAVVRIEKDQKTSVARSGETPSAPVKMTQDEIGAGQALENGIDEGVKKAELEGRVLQIQSVAEIEDFILEEKKKTLAAGAKPAEPELSRVTDTRRRPFAGDSLMAPPEPPLPPETEETPAAPKPDA